MPEKITARPDGHKWSSACVDCKSVGDGYIISLQFNIDDDCDFVHTDYVAFKQNNAVEIELSAHFQLIDLADIGAMPKACDVLSAAISQNCEISIVKAEEVFCVVLKTELVEDREILFPLTPSQYSKLVQV